MGDAHYVFVSASSLGATKEEMYYEDYFKGRFRKGILICNVGS